ncbi:hypothetical protein V6N11_077428 [Hibiscus sabdariffa]|uniref:Uncharacterized protein n=1 Tax=Hibiscus sabdariffa TaxID=183260 RepID=A0ABR2TD28_9ROSI
MEEKREAKGCRLSFIVLRQVSRLKRRCGGSLWSFDDGALTLVDDKEQRYLPDEESQGMKSLIVFFFWGLRRVKKKVDFAAHVLILFKMCNEAQTSLVDLDRKAHDQTFVAMALLYSLPHGQFVDVGATHEPVFNVDDHVEGHPQTK